MKDLIAALTILSRYTDTKYPTHCEHDVLYVLVDPNLVPEKEKELLGTLGFYSGETDIEIDCFYSYKYGSA